MELGGGRGRASLDEAEDYFTLVMVSRNARQRRVVS
jgi:hypothetical protein